MGIFDWFAPSCPVEPEERAWLDERMLWLVGQFGFDRLDQTKLVLPTPEFFPDAYDRSPDAALLMFKRVQAYMGLESERIRVGFYTDEEAGDRRGGQPGVVYHTRGAAGLFHGFRGKVGEELQISVEAHQLAKPLSLVATLAHELGHVHLIGHGRIANDAEDHEPLTDLLTIFFGMGVFTANSIIQESNWQSGGMSGWSVGRLGYLTQLQAGYALALFAWLRREEWPWWMSEVCADVRAPLKSALRLFQSGDMDERLAALRRPL